MGSNRRSAIPLLHWPRAPCLDSTREPIRLKKTLPLFAAIAATFLISYCIIAITDDGASFRGFSSHFGEDSAKRGSGVVGEDARELGAFTSISLSGSLYVEATAGADQRVTVRGDDNLLEDVITEVRNGVLCVELQSGSYNFKKPMVVRVQVPELTGVQLQGSGDFAVQGIAQDQFNVTLRGSGDIVVKGLETKDLRVNLEGSGDIEVTGKTDKLTATLRGSGDMNLAGLVAAHASTTLAGSGDIRVHASEALNVTLAGSGEVGYTGEPMVKKTTAGSGEVYKFH